MFALDAILADEHRKDDATDTCVLSDAVAKKQTVYMCGPASSGRTSHIASHYPYASFLPLIDDPASILRAVQSACLTTSPIPKIIVLDNWDLYLSYMDQRATVPRDVSAKTTFHDAYLHIFQRTQHPCILVIESLANVPKEYRYDLPCVTFEPSLSVRPTHQTLRQDNLLTCLETQRAKTLIGISQSYDMASTLMQCMIPVFDLQVTWSYLKSFADVWETRLHRRVYDMADIRPMCTVASYMAQTSSAFIPPTSLYSKMTCDPALLKLTSHKDLVNAIRYLGTHHQATSSKRQTGTGIRVPRRYR
jgi:hypothetical protein